MFSQIQLYFHTIKYLTPRQFLGRLWHRLYHPGPPSNRALPLRACDSPFHGSQREASMLGANEFSFLNVRRHLVLSTDWNNAEWPLLWRYNLHYFDDLAATDAGARRDWHDDLIARWVRENPPVSGAGWEPYPISLRVVNWIKYHLITDGLTVLAQQSLAQQVRFLRRRLEYHLLGNHLWANAKALVFAGCFFEGPEAEGWRRKGLSLIQKELGEQIFKDGGHFERSPMYHAIVLNDLLDLIQLAGLYPALISAQVVSHWHDCARSMIAWLQVMTHPDGELSFFNDTTLGIAPSLGALTDYVKRLEVGGADFVVSRRILVDTGYARLQCVDAVLLVDVGLIGPDYLPGHAHADTLSFEVSLFGQRVFVNQGIDRYGADQERLRQRGTAAHNTAVVEGQNSSEVWHGFRVARRARPFDLHADLDSDSQTLSCSHDGYQRLPGRVTHTREWQLTEGSLSIRDTLTGQWHEAFASLHLHPDVLLLDFNQSTCDLNVAGRVVKLTVEGGKLVVENGTYHPGFGVSQACVSLRFILNRNSLITRVEW